MLRAVVVGVFILGGISSTNALSLKKAAEGGRFPNFCIFGMCIADKKEYDESVKTYKNRDAQIEELTRKSEEMDQWKKEDEERSQLERDEAKAKKQEEKDRISAQSCQCTWECGDRNDGTVCFRKCCNNEFGGNPNKVLGSAVTPDSSQATAAADPVKSVLSGLFRSSAATPEPSQATAAAALPGSDPGITPLEPTSPPGPNALDVLSSVFMMPTAGKMAQPGVLAPSSGAVPPGAITVSDGQPAATPTFEPVKIDKRVGWFNPANLNPFAVSVDYGPTPVDVNGGGGGQKKKAKGAR